MNGHVAVAPELAHIPDPERPIMAAGVQFLRLRPLEAHRGHCVRVRHQRFYAFSYFKIDCTRVNIEEPDHSIFMGAHHHLPVPPVQHFIGLAAHFLPLEVQVVSFAAFFQIEHIQLVLTSQPAHQLLCAYEADRRGAVRTQTNLRILFELVVGDVDYFQCAV